MAIAAADTHIMDHRFGCRHAIRATVILVTPDGSEVSAILRDISMSGAFVETRAKRWRPYLPVEFQLTGGSAGVGVQTRAIAMVVRSTSDGVALMFDVAKPALVASLNPGLDMDDPCAAPRKVRARQSGRRLRNSRPTVPFSR